MSLRPGRIRLRKNPFLLGLLTLTVLLAVWSIGIEPRWVAQRQFNVTLPQAPALQGLKIAIASDWHITKHPALRVMTAERARRIVDQINAAKPDVILLPGDFIADRYYKPEQGQTAEAEVAAVLGQLKAPLGVYATLGNHDWHDGAKMRSALGKHGIQVLENNAVPLGNTGAWVAGIGDYRTWHSKPLQAIAKLPQDAPALIMMHNPASFMELPRLNALFIAAHTHGGQVYLPGIGALITRTNAPRAWAYGWVRHHGNEMYVTSGLGVSILPIRFNMRPEWVLMTLSSQAH
ncbi:MAG TPA: metallophosphoesterase [Methylophilaceae bacterium]|nr:metallophosphoesterase [Methylophilaceae bacterium]